MAVSPVVLPLRRRAYQHRPWRGRPQGFHDSVLEDHPLGGKIRAWIDGRPAFQKSDVRFRRVARLKIEQIWINVYHGGTKPSPCDRHLFVDNVVIVGKYIGPMAAQAPGR